VPSLDSVTFDATGLTFGGERNGARIWSTASGDAVTLHYFPIPPDIPVGLGDLAAIRDASRTAAMQTGAAIIEVDIIAVDELMALRQVVKVPQQPHGITYLGSITLPYRSFSFVLKIQCTEYGTTGMRDAAILDELMNEGRVTVDGRARAIRGWMQDPYDPTLTDGFRKNLSEDAKYDARFPAHPLSRLRPLLTRLHGTIQLTDELRGHPPFSPHVVRRRPWWHVW
jgi:hypothetical protein